MFTGYIFLIYTYIKDLALNNLQWLIYHKTKPDICRWVNQGICLPNPSITFSWTGYLTNSKEPSWPNYFLINGGKTRIHAFSKGISAKWKANNSIKNVNSKRHFLLAQSADKIRPHPITNVLDVTLNCFWWWGFSPGALVDVVPLHYHCPVGWNCRIHQLHLCSGVRPPH